jgi:UTP--glucose-1-phosphate uridylyltransferase
VAQTAEADRAAFADENRHAYFHTNNLWFDLRALAATLEERQGVLGLPLIRNLKTVDPADPSSPQVVQIETAMGAAIEVFSGARALEVERSRFLPVKTTNDLMLIRSDLYTLRPDFQLVREAERLPLVDLDPAYYKTIDAFAARFPDGVPSLREAESLTVRGDWTFGADVRVAGAVTLDDTGTPERIPDGTVLSGGS